MATYKQIQTWVKQNYGFVPATCWITDVKSQAGLPMRKAPNRKGTKRKSIALIIQRDGSLIVRAPAGKRKTNSGIRQKKQGGFSPSRNWSRLFIPRLCPGST